MLTGLQQGEIAAAALIPLVLVVVTVLWFRRRRRDEVFIGLTPGELPALGQQVSRARVPRGRSEWSGTVAVRFTPPDGVTPGLMGTVIDGSADVVDVSSTLVDLAVRGYLRLHAEPRDPSITEPPPPPPGTAKAAGSPASGHDWRMTRVRPEPAGTLLPFERQLLEAVFKDGDETTIARLKAQGFDLTMREAQVGLYREVVDRGYYTAHPRDRNRRLGCLGVPVLLLGLILGVGALAALGDYRITRFQGLLLLGLAGGLVISAVILLAGGRGRTPRTAEGSAVRIQALGFREYLTKAEASQIRFEEARDLFSRYLPYAMVFGVADRWAKVFAQVAASAHLQGLGDAYFDLTWIDGFDVLGDVLGSGLDAVHLIDGIANISSGWDFPDLGDLGSGLGDIASGAGDFVSSAGNLLDFGDGCSGCDGCDGCDLGF